jgi:hypothetical protein
MILSHVVIKITTTSRRQISWQTPRLAKYFRRKQCTGGASRQDAHVQRIYYVLDVVAIFGTTPLHLVVASKQHVFVH